MTSRTGEAGSLKGLETLYQIGAVGNLTDGQLLGRFVSGRGAGEAAEAVFTAMVDRHGPMVLRVCRQILGDTHDAEDAFQATFLVLVRKAGSVRKRDSVASWLHGIARRVARRARSDRARRLEYERRGAEMAGRTEARSAGESGCWPELHEEVARLPEKYREAIVLCYLEGLTTDEASRRLDCPQGTVLSRLSRARDRLRDRLNRRGLAVPAGLISADASRAAAVPPALAHSVIQSARKLAVGGAATTVVPASIAGLTRGVLRTMILTRLGITGAALAALAALAVGTRTLLIESPAAGPRASGTTVETASGPSILVGHIGEIRGLFTPGLIPADLRWIDVGPDRRLQTLDLMEDRTRNNFERIRTWKGTYTYTLRQLLSGRAVPVATRNGLPMQNLKEVMQQFDGSIRFAIDMTNGSMYRDKRTTAMTFFKPETKEAVDVRGVGARDFRSIVTNERIVVFPPDELVTYAYLQHLPEARHKRLARQYDRGTSDPRARDMIQMRLGGPQSEHLDPRLLFSLDADKPAFSLLEMLAGALRAAPGNQNRREFESRFSLAQADGPDGRWYCHQQWFDTGNGTSLWTTTFWSPRAGYNPVAHVMTHDKPDGKVSTKVEWQWTPIDGIFLPSRVLDLACEKPGGPPARERTAALDDCVLNRPLDPHQFDHAGLGMADGDVLINEARRVGYIIKDGEPVKLGEFVNPR